jgi:hypothetical protein
VTASRSFLFAAVIHASTWLWCAAYKADSARCRHRTAAWTRFCGGVLRRGCLTGGHGVVLAEWVLSSWRDVVPARAAAWPPVWDDPPAVEDLTAPHAGVLLAVDGDGEAGQPNGAGAAQRLGPLEVGGRVGKPKLGVVALTRQLRRNSLSGVSDRAWRTAVRAAAVSVSHPVIPVDEGLQRGGVGVVSVSGRCSA